MEPTRLSFLQAFYSQQTLLLTGASGFVGKVLLAQLLRATPAKKIYVLLRGSRDRSAQERLMNDIFSSPAFDELKRKIEEREAWPDHLQRRVEAVSGDLLLPKLGMQQHQIEKLREEVTVVIHVAASVHFTASLKDNYRSNVEGTMRVLDFAKTCKNMQVFVQTSTCYVHSDQVGRIKEDVLPVASNVEDLLTSVHRMIDLRERQDKHPNMDITGMEAQLLGKFPNTYTFTKRLSEVLLLREWERAQGGNGIRFPLCILRPSIVGVAYQHPRRGWIDTLNATGGMLLLCALGVLKCLPANPHLIGDNVPVDMVADALIVAGAAVAAAHALANPTAAAAPAARNSAAAASAAAAACVAAESLPRPIELSRNSKAHPGEEGAAVPTDTASAATGRPAGGPGVYVFHCGTSDTNPMQWGDILIYGREYSMMNPYFHRLSRMLYTPYFEEEFDDFRRSFFILQRLPAAVAARITSYFLPATSRVHRSVHLYHSGIKRVKKVADAFRPFSYREWIFEQRNQRLLQHLLTEEEKKTFLLNTEDINWRTWTHYFFYGIARWLLGEQSGTAFINTHAALLHLFMRTVEACEPPPPPHLYVNLLHKHVLCEPHCPPGFLARLFPGPAAMQFLRNFAPVTTCPSPEALQQQVLSSKPVLAAQQAEVQRMVKASSRRRKRKDGKPAGTTPQEIDAEVREETLEIYSRIAGTIKPAAAYLMGGLLHTAFLRLFDRIVVDKMEVERLTKAVREFKGPIVLLPTHRSHLDFLLLFHLCLSSGLPLPFVPVDERMEEISFISSLLRRTGAFFVKHKVTCCSSSAPAGSSSTSAPPLPPRLYCAVLQEFVRTVARRHGLLELFIEGGRSKNGLLKVPRHALLRALIDLYFSASQTDLLFVPITISYDRVLEAEWLPTSSSSSRSRSTSSRGSTSSQTQQHPLLQVINTCRSACTPGPDNTIKNAGEKDGVRQRFGIGFKPLGSAYIRIAEPVSIKEFLERHVGESHAAKGYLPAAEEEDGFASNDWELSSSRLPPLRRRQQQQQQKRRLHNQSGDTAQSGRGAAAPSSASADDSGDSEKTVTREVCTMLAEHVSNVFVSNLVISPTSLVATVLSMHHTGIREEDLIKQVDWLRDQVLLRGGILSPGLGGLMYDTRLIVQAALRTYLQHVVVPRRRNEGMNGRRGWAAAACLRAPAEPQAMSRILGSSLRALPAAAASAAATASLVAAAGTGASPAAAAAAAATATAAATAATTVAAVAVAPSFFFYRTSGRAPANEDEETTLEEIEEEAVAAAGGQGRGRQGHGSGAAAAADPRPCLVLAYYRNQCCHLFAAEAAVCVALLSFGCDCVWAPPGVPQRHLFKTASFLLRLLREFLVGSKTSLAATVSQTVQLLVQREILCQLPSSGAAAPLSLAASEARAQQLQQRGEAEHYWQEEGAQEKGKEEEFHQQQQHEEAYSFHSATEMHVSLFSNFVWPFVDTLWACATALYALQPRQNKAGTAHRAGPPERREANESICITKQQLVARFHWAADALYKAGFLSFIESSSLPAVRRALYAFRRFGLLQQHDSSSSSTRGSNSSAVRIFNAVDPDDEEADGQQVLLELASPYEKEDQLQDFIDRLQTMRKCNVGEGGRATGCSSGRKRYSTREERNSVENLLHKHWLSDSRTNATLVKISDPPGVNSPQTHPCARQRGHACGNQKLVMQHMFLYVQAYPVV